MIIWAVLTVFLLSSSDQVLDVILPGEKIRLTYEPYQIENEVWISGGDIYSEDTIVYQVPLIIEVYDPNGDIYRSDRTRSKSFEERSSIACAVACGPGFDYHLLEITDTVPKGEWTVTVRFEGDETYRSTENSQKFWVE